MQLCVANVSTERALRRGDRPPHQVHRVACVWEEDGGGGEFGPLLSAVEHAASLDGVRGTFTLHLVYTEGEEWLVSRVIIRCIYVYAVCLSEKFVVIIRCTLLVYLVSYSLSILIPLPSLPL